MHAFEVLVAELLQKRGYWVHGGFVLPLQKDEKVTIGKPTMPNPCIDIVAFQSNPVHGDRPELLLLEVKSFLDSPGVHSTHLDQSHKYGRRYRLLVDDRFRTMVTRKTKSHFVRVGAIPTNTRVRVGLVAGKAQDSESIESLARGKGWYYVGPDAVRNELRMLANQPFQDSLISYVAKVLRPILHQE